MSVKVLIKLCFSVSFHSCTQTHFEQCSLTSWIFSNSISISEISKLSLDFHIPITIND